MPSGTGLGVGYEKCSAFPGILLFLLATMDHGGAGAESFHNWLSLIAKVRLPSGEYLQAHLSGGLGDQTGCC